MPWEKACVDRLVMTVIMMVHDYLGYRFVIGQVFHGYCGCTRCMDDMTSQQLMSRNTSRENPIHRTLAVAWVRKACWC